MNKLGSYQYLFGFAVLLIFGSALIWMIWKATPQAQSTTATAAIIPSDTTPAASAVALDDNKEDLKSTPHLSTPHWDERLAALSAQLLDEQRARQRLEGDLSTLQAQLASLEQKLQKLIPDRRRHRRGESQQQISSLSFFEAGFDNATANYLAERWSEQEMALLYLRDQATREGWADTEQYQQAARELRQESVQLREELGEENYARYLYALGRPNLVHVDSVISNSPAQAAGLLPGDRIIRYDGQRIYNRRGLREISTAGEPDLPVTVLIERDGVLIEAIMPRGPLGVMLSPLSELSAG